MEKLMETAEYKDVADAARKLKIDYVGVKKTKLIEKVNAKIDSIAAGETETPVVEETKVEDTNEQGNTTEENTKDETTTTKTTTARRGRKANSTPAEPRVRKTKWYDEADADLPYAVDDIIEVHSGEILVGRTAQIVKMSAKKHAVKAILIHPVKGTLQGCVITLDYDKIKKAADQTAPKSTDEAATEKLINETTETTETKEEDTASQAV